YAVGHAAQHRLDAPARAGTATDGGDDLPQRRAHPNFPDTVAPGVAGHRADDGAGRGRRADGAVPGRAPGDDAGDVGHGLQVVDQRRSDGPGFVPSVVLPGRGRGDQVDLAPQSPAEGRDDARQGVPALDRLEQCALFPVEVLVGTLEDGQLDTTGPPGRLDLPDGLPGPGHLRPEGTLEGDDHEVGSDGP